MRNDDISQGSDVTPTHQSVFSYDAAGNRTSMMDGSGSVSYAYNTLAHLTSGREPEDR